MFLNRSYWPDAEATGQLLTELCEDLSRSFDVSVIAGQPNHNAEGAAYHANGVEQRHGVRINRVWHTQFSKRSFVGRIINFITFCLSAFARGVRQTRPAVLIAETDPPILCLIAWLLAKWHGCALVMYLQDIYPDIAVALGKLKPGVCYSLLRRLMYAAYRRADRVVVLSDDMRKFMIANGVAAEKIVYLSNWVDTRVIQPVKRDNSFRREHCWDTKFVAMYSGNLGLSQRLDDVLHAAELLREETEFQFVFVGSGASKQDLMELAERKKLPNVQFLPYQPKDALGVSLSAADIHLVPIDPRVTSFLMPSKLYGILASGTPVLAIGSEECHLAQIVLSARVGLLSPTGSPAAIADQLRWALQHQDEMRRMGERARELAEREYDRGRQTSAFRELLLGVLEDRQQGRDRVVDISASPWPRIEEGVGQPTMR